MAYTETDRDRLKKAIASGTLSAEIEGRRVTYRSISEMMRALAFIEADIAAGDAAVTGVTRTRRIVFTDASGF